MLLDNSKEHSKDNTQGDVKQEDKAPDMNGATDESEKLKSDAEECEKTDAEKNEEETVREEEGSEASDSPECKSLDSDEQTSETSSGDSLRSSDETRPILTSKNTGKRDSW